MKYTPSGHSPIKVARVYLRVSTDEQDLTRQSEIEQSAIDLAERKFSGKLVLTVS